MRTFVAIRVLISNELIPAFSDERNTFVRELMDIVEADAFSALNDSAVNESTVIAGIFRVLTVRVLIVPTSPTIDATERELMFIVLADAVCIDRVSAIKELTNTSESMNSMSETTRELMFMELAEPT
jgi:hypothetical protein